MGEARECPSGHLIEAVFQSQAHSFQLRGELTFRGRGPRAVSELFDLALHVFCLELEIVRAEMAQLHEYLLGVAAVSPWLLFDERTGTTHVCER